MSDLDSSPTLERAQPSRRERMSFGEAALFTWSAYAVVFLGHVLWPAWRDHPQNLTHVASFGALLDLLTSSPWGGSLFGGTILLISGVVFAGLRRLYNAMRGNEITPIRYRHVLALTARGMGLGVLLLLAVNITLSIFAP